MSNVENPTAKEAENKIISEDDILGKELAAKKLVFQLPEEKSIRRSILSFDSILKAGEKWIIVFSMIIMSLIVFLDIIWRVSNSPTSAVGKIIKFSSVLLGFEYTADLADKIDNEFSFYINWLFGYGIVWLAQYFLNFKKDRKVSQLRVHINNIIILAGLKVSHMAFMALFETGFPWSQTVALCLMLYVGFLGASLATREQKHISIDSVRRAMPKAFGKRLDSLSAVTCAAFCIFLGVLGIQYASFNFTDWVKWGFTTSMFETVPIPYWTVSMIIPISFFIGAFRFIVIAHHHDSKKLWSSILIVLGVVGIFIAVPYLTEDMLTKVILVFVFLILALILGTPMFVTMAVLTTGLFYFVTEDHRTLDSYQVYIEKIFELTDKNVLLAIPFFVLSGSMMSTGGIADKLVKIANALVGWLPGGLAIATVFACIFFAAMSGSSPVTVIAIGGMMYPALLKERYNSRFSVGLLTSAGSLGILIPPSIPMIIYGIVVTGKQSINIEDLYLAGLGPGLLLGLMLMFYSFITGIRGGFNTQPFSIKGLLIALRDGIWALFLPIIILGGIYTGIFTPTEAAAVSVIYAFVVEVFIHQGMKLADIPTIIYDSTIMIGGLLIIMVLAFGLNDFLVEIQLPEQAVELIKSYDLSTVGFLLLVNILLLIVGLVMDIFSAILILSGLLAPIAFSLGIDPIHMGIITIVNLEIGYLTPPFGLNLFVSSSLFQKGYIEVVKSTLPFVAIMVVGLMLITYVPTVSMGLVNLTKGESFYVPFPEKRDLSEDSASKKDKQTLEDLMKMTEEDDEDWDADEDTDDSEAASMDDMMKDVLDEVESEEGEEASDESEIESEEPASMDDMMKDALNEVKEEGSGTDPPESE